MPGLEWTLFTTSHGWLGWFKMVHFGPGASHSYQIVETDSILFTKGYRARSRRALYIIHYTDERAYFVLE